MDAVSANVVGSSLTPRRRRDSDGGPDPCCVAPRGGIGALDALIAGIARRHDATLATADSDFGEVDDLPVVNLRRDEYDV